jgi:hypothetical protein
MVDAIMFSVPIAKLISAGNAWNNSNQVHFVMIIWRNNVEESLILELVDLYLDIMHLSVIYQNQVVHRSANQL